MFSKTLAYSPVIPGTVTVSATIGAATVTATDDAHGAISGTGVSGTIDYDTGELSVTYTTAPDDPSNVTVAYSYGYDTKRHVAMGILVEAIDATSANKTAQVYLAGEFRETDLSWPSAIAAANKTRAKAELRERGIIVK